MNESRIAASLNFSWLLDGQLAGSAAPMLVEDLEFLHAQGIRALVRLACPGRDDFVIDASDVREVGLEDLHIPVEDFQAPDQEQIDRALSFIVGHLGEGKPVAVSCGAGCGRTGTILACFLIIEGYSADDALKFLISKRPCSNEIVRRTPEQKAAIYDFERRFKAGEVAAFVLVPGGSST